MILYYYVMNIFDSIKNIRINSCGISDCTPSWSWDTGARGFNDFDLWTVFRGKGALSVDGKEYPASVGTSLLLSPGKRYVGRHDEKDPLLVINVHFDFIDEKGLPIIPKEVDFSAKQITDIVFMRGLLYRTVRLFNRKERGLAESIFGTALAEFFLHPLDNSDDRSADSKQTVIQEICDMINTDPSRIPSLGEFSKKYGYSPDYLGRIFSSYSGITLSEYVFNARINKAKLLLSSSDYTVEAISVLTGYYDSCYFVRQFRRATGKTPGEYRKSGR